MELLCKGHFQANHFVLYWENNLHLDYFHYGNGVQRMSFLEGVGHSIVFQIYVMLTLLVGFPICKGIPKSSINFSISWNLISLPAAPLSEITPAERSSVACWPVGMMVSKARRFRAEVKWLRFTSGKYFRQNSVTQAYCSPLKARRMETDWPSLHSTSCKVDWKPNYGNTKLCV